MPVRLLSLAVAAFLALSAVPVDAQEYRAYWVETFNTALATSADIDRVISNCTDSNCNAIFAQVRRRGDSWYLDSLEPLGAPVSPTFDPLANLIARAHARGIEVHAFVIVGTIYNGHPTITGLPKPGHAFRTHVWNTATNTLLPSDHPAMWSTRSLPHNQGGTTFNGQRYAAEWYIDLGHPDAASYTVDVLSHLATRYDVDGIHLDRIRYPEAPINRLTGQPLSINVGYNATSVQRFKNRHGSEASYYEASEVGTTISTNPLARVTAGDVGFPKTGDPLWSQWRRDQVTNFVRRLYLRLAEVRPNIKLSAALICFWSGPVGSGGWERTEAYYRVFQDWKLWAEEGILDIIMPMAYKREHTPVERGQFNDWMTFTKSLAAASGRHGLIGHGAYMNSIEGTLLQIRRAASIAPNHGSVIYALGNTTPGNVTHNSTNAAVANNSVSYPTAGVSTPRRPNSEFFAAVKSGLTLAPYEPTSLTPVWSTFVPPPAAPWKQSLGHIAGFAIGSNGPLDAADVTIEPIEGGSVVRRSTTGADGFYGGAGLDPGQYRVNVRLRGDSLWAVPFVSAATVTRANPVADTVNPSVTITFPTGGARFVYSEAVPPASFHCSDALSGVATCNPSPFGTFTTGAQVFAVTATDRAGNVSSAAVTYEVVRAATAVSVSYTEERNRMVIIATLSALAPATATPDGTVEFVDKNHGSLGAATLIGGVARLEVQKRSLHLTATYGGNANFAGSAAADVHVVPRNQ